MRSRFDADTTSNTVMAAGVAGVAFVLLTTIGAISAETTALFETNKVNHGNGTSVIYTLTGNCPPGDKLISDGNKLTLPKGCRLVKTAVPAQ